MCYILTVIKKIRLQFKTGILGDFWPDFQIPLSTGAKNTPLRTFQHSCSTRYTSEYRLSIFFERSVISFSSFEWVIFA